MAHHSPNPSSREDDRGIYRQYNPTGKQSFTNYTSEPRQQKSFWTTLARRAKSAILDDGLSLSNTRDAELMKDRNYESLQQTRSFADNKQRHSEITTFQKKLESITSSISSFGDAIGNALEEGLNIVETKTTDFLTSDTRKLFTKKSFDSATRSMQQHDHLKGTSQQHQTVKISSLEENNTALSQQQDSTSRLYSQQIRNSVNGPVEGRESGSETLHERDFVAESLQRWKKLDNTEPKRGNDSSKHFQEDLGTQVFSAPAAGGSKSLHGVSDSLQSWNKLGQTVRQADNNHSKPFQQDSRIEEYSITAGDDSNSLQGRDLTSDSLQRWQTLGKTVPQGDNHMPKPSQQDSGVQDHTMAAGHGSKSLQGRDLASDSWQRWKTLGKTVPQGDNPVSNPSHQKSGIQEYSVAAGDGSKSVQGRDFVSNSLQQWKTLGKTVPEGNNHIAKPSQQDSGIQDYSVAPNDRKVRAFRDISIEQNKKTVSKPLQGRDFSSDSLIAQKESETKILQQSNSISKPNQKHGSGVQDISAADKDIQLKASRDVAMAMATKAKLLSRELKETKAELAVAKERCAQLEEENKMIRESLGNGLKLDEEDLVRMQLETLLAEKAHLTQENAYYVRENQFLRDMLEYHRATMQVCGLTPEQISDVADFASELDEENDLPPEIIISTVPS